MGFLNDVLGFRRTNTSINSVTAEKPERNPDTCTTVDIHEKVPVFVLVKGIQSPLSIKGSFDRWLSAIPLTQLGDGCCYFVKLDKQSFEYTYCSKDATEPEYTRVYRDNRRDTNPIIDYCLGSNTLFYAHDLVIALADVLHSGQLYIKDINFLCNVTRSIFEDLVFEKRLVTSGVDDSLKDELQSSIKILVLHGQSDLVQNLIKRFPQLTSFIPLTRFLSTSSTSLLNFVNH
ncbi:hypothetical protein GEMRC1_002247 [Eukaryota sp. GEM-RC1]